MLEVICCYDVGNCMLNHVGSRIFLRYWKLYVVWRGMSYVVQRGKSYVFTKLDIVCCPMWEVVCFGELLNVIVCWF